MATYRATIKLYPDTYKANSYEEAEQMLEEYKDQLGSIENTIEFRDYHLSVELEEDE
jgi:hypothetical protein